MLKKTYFHCTLMDDFNYVLINTNFELVPKVGLSGHFSYKLNHSSCGKHRLTFEFDMEFFSDFISISCSRCINQNIINVIEHK